MREGGFERFAPLAGTLFLVLAVISFIVTGEGPDADDSTAKVVRYWTENDAENIAASIIAVFAALLLVWFGASLRSVVWRAEGGSGRLAAIVFAATVILGVALLTDAGFQFAIADTAGDVPAQTTQTLSALYGDFFFPFAGGCLLLNIATGIAILRYRFLPRWLGFLMLLLAIIGVTPIGFIGFLATILWIGVVGMLLFVRGSQEPSAPPPGPATGSVASGALPGS